LSGRIAAGIGTDFSSDGSGIEAGFFESSIEKFFTPSWGARLEYDFYTSRSEQSFSSGTHIARLSFIKEWE